MTSDAPERGLLAAASWPLTPEHKRAAILDARAIALRDLANDDTLPIGDHDRAALRRVAARLRVTATILLRRGNRDETQTDSTTTE